MVDLRPVFMSWSLSPLEAAFKGGEDQIGNQIERCVREYDAHNEALAVGLADREWRDPETGEAYDKGGWILAEMAVIDDVLQAHRKAFAVMIHHTWEKHVCEFMKLPRYYPNSEYGPLKAAGWQIDIDGLTLLRQIANCVKHDSAELYDAHPKMFTNEGVWFEPVQSSTKKIRKTDGRVSKDGWRGRWEEALRLQHDDILNLFDIVKRSANISGGPKSMNCLPPLVARTMRDIKRQRIPL